MAMHTDPLRSRSILVGITRPGRTFQPPANPAPHAPLPLQNRVIAEVWGPEGLKQRIDHTGNMMVTYGLNRLIEMLASDSDGASDWVSAGAIGTGTTAVGYSDNSMIASTGIVHMSEASMVASDAGARTLQYNMTFASNNPAGAAEINEVGIFATNNATEAMVGRSVLGTDSINKGASDSLYISYQVIAQSAAA
jgi:hypothetical protein